MQDREILYRKAIWFLKSWWCSILLLPFIYQTLHQTYWALRFNIFFAVSYNFSFPVNLFYLFLDTFLLIVHEAGHTFFALIGFRFLTILGGSLFQLILPGLILFYTWSRLNRTGTQLALYLMGLSFLDVAIYAADAGQQQLPLIGGLSRESHDWYNMLRQLNWLDYDLPIALLLISAGTACYLLAIGLPAIPSFSRGAPP